MIPKSPSRAGTLFFGRATTALLSLLLATCPARSIVAAPLTFTNATTANGLGSNNVFGVYASGSTVYAATYGGGLAISTNGGASFTNATTANGLGSNNVYGVYATGSSVYAATENGLAISTNGGSSFTNATTANGLGNDNVYGVYASGSSVYAATYGGGLAISTNGGASFTNATTANGLGSNYVLGVYASGSSVYAATENGLAISTNGGSSFTNATTTNGLGSYNVQGVYASGSTVYAATLGVSISTNGGSSFTNATTANGLGSNNAFGVYASGGSIYAATYGGGLAVSTNGGSSYSTYTTANGLGSNNAFAVYASGNTVYAATDGGLSIGLPKATWNTTSGTWNTTSTLWTSGTWSPFAFTSGDLVTFSGTGGGVVTISGTIQPTSITVSATSGTYSFVSSAGNLLAGTTGLAKSGGGTLVLSGSNAYSGGTSLSAGTLRIAQDGALGTGSLSLAGGTLASANASSRTLQNAVSVTGNPTFGDATGNGALILSGAVDLGNATRTLTNTTFVTLSGPISNGALTKAGAGNLILTGANTYSGLTTVSQGTLFIGGGTTGSIAGDVTVASGATLAFNRSDSVTYGGAISGGGTVIQYGPGTLTLTGSSTNSGWTNVFGGTLAIGDGGTAGSITGNVFITNNATLAFDRSDAITYGGSISGDGFVIKRGSSVLTLTADSPFTGTVDIMDFGTLRLGDGGTTGSIGGRIQLNYGHVVFDRSDAVTHGGDMVGDGNLTMEGTGTLTLTGNNHFNDSYFDYAVNLADGTLALGSTGAIGATGKIAFNGGTLRYTASNTTDYSDRFSTDAGQAYKLDTNGQSVTLATGLTSAGGSLTKSGAGTLTLTGSNTYSGPTTVSTGTLAIGGAGGSIAGNASVASGANLTFARTTDHTYTGTISGSGAVTKTGASTLTITGSNTYSGPTTVSTGTLAIGGAGGSIAGNASVASGANLTFARTTDHTYAGTISGSGAVTKTGASTLTITGSNTYTGLTTVSSGTLAVGGASGSIAGNASVASGANLTFGRTNDLTYSGTISGAGAVTKSGATTLTLTGSNTFTGLTTVSSGTLAIGGTNGAITGNASVASGATLAFNRSTNLTYAGAVSGSGRLVQSGNNVLTLTGNNSYTGGTVLTSGTLALGSTNALGTSGTISFGGGTLRLTAANSSDYSARFSSAPGQDYKISNSDQNVVLASALSSPGGSLTKYGHGNLILSGSNTYTGLTTVAEGMLFLGNGGTTGSIAGDVVLESGGWLAFNRTDDFTFAGTISGSGAIWQGMGNTVTLTADNTSTGMTFVGGGTLSVGAGGTTGSIAGNTDVYSGGRIVFNRSDALTYAGVISGDGSLEKKGGGTLTLTGASTHTGGTIVSAGTLALGGADGSIIGDATVADGATLAFGRTNDLVFNGIVSGEGAVVQSGPSVLTLTGINDYSGGTTVTSGTVAISGEGSFGGSEAGLGSGAVSIGSGAQVTYWLSDWEERTIANPFSLAGGTLHSEDGANTFSGPITLASGQSTISGQYEDTVTLSGGLAGTGDVLFTQRGSTGGWSAPTFVLAAAGTNTGTVRVDGSSGGGSTTLQVADVNALQSATLDLATGDVGTVEFTAAGTNTYALGGLQGSRDLALGANSLSVGGNGQTTTYSGDVSGSGSLTKVGAGTLTLSGSNSFSGGTNIDAGTLALGHADALGTSGTISFGGGTLRFTSGNSSDLSGRFSSAASQQYNLDTNGRIVSLATGLVSSGGTLTKSGNGNLVLTGANTYSGLTTVAAGALFVGAGGTSGSIAGDVTVASGATLAFNRSDSFTYGGAISGQGTVITYGPGTLTLTGNNTNSGWNFLYGGTLAIGNGGTSGSITGNVGTVAGTTLLFNRSDASTYAGRVSGEGALVKQGAGTLTLTGYNFHSGPTTVQAGTLVVNGSLSASAVTVQAGATLSGDAFLGSSLTVLASGTLSPGNSPGTVTAATVTLAAGSTTLMEIAAGGAGTGYDTIVVTGSSGLTYGGTLALTFSNTTAFADGTTFDLFQFTGATSGSFSAVTFAAPGGSPYAGLSFTRGGDGAWYSGDTAGGQYLTFSPSTGNLVVVPEPSTWVAAVVGIAFAARFARRRRPA